MTRRDDDPVLAAIVAAVEAPCAALDAGLCFVATNAALCDVLATAPDDLLDKALEDVVPAPAFGQLADELRALADEPNARLERRAPVRSGAHAELDVRLTCTRLTLPDGHAARWLVTVDDDADLTRRMTQLRVAERALHAAASGIVICDATDPELPMTYVNAAFEQVTGYAPSEVLGRNCRFLNERDREQPGLREVRAALREAREATVVLRNFRKDGTPFWNELTISPVVDGDGRVTHFIGIQDDITDRMEFAAERERLLGDAMAQQQAAARAAQARDTLLAVVSHELRSPLNGIRLWTSLLNEQDHVDRDLIERAVGQIEHGVAMQSRIIEDLLDVSRFESGRLELRRGRHDLVDVAREVVERNAPAAGERGVALTFEAEAARAVVLADRERIAQVLQNLCDNALKFTPEGGRVTVRLTVHDGRARVAVTDTGRGIEAKQLRSVFEQFWQAKGRDARTHGGLGLGLNLVKHIVEHHDGRVEAHSDGPGRGATLAFELPLREERPAARHAQAGGPAAARGELAGDLLVADDDPGTVEALALGLRMRGYEVRVAKDVETAVAALRERRPRALVSDLMMGDSTGFELVAALRDHEFDERLDRAPAIAISGRGNPHDERAARLAGFDRYLTKPVGMGLLADQLDELLAPDRAAAPTPSVLIAHPEHEHGSRLREALLDQGYAVQLADSAATALAIVDVEPCDAVLAAADLLDGTGEALLESVRRDNEDTLTLLDGGDGSPGEAPHTGAPLDDVERVARILARWHPVPRPLG